MVKSMAPLNRNLKESRALLKKIMTVTISMSSSSKKLISRSRQKLMMMSREGVRVGRRREIQLQRIPDIGRIGYVAQCKVTRRLRGVYAENETSLGEKLLVRVCEAQVRQKFVFQHEVLTKRPVIGYGQRADMSALKFGL
jgi:hypothetical protein